MSKQIDLVAYRAELQQKIEAIDLILGGASSAGSPARRGRAASTRTRSGKRGRRTMSPAARARLAAIARARWKKARLSGKSHL
jgi:hypothetical protein